MCNSFDIKALLTLLLLKQGTTSRDIQAAVNLTATARLMVAKEYADIAQHHEAAEAGNVARIRSSRQSDVDAVRPFEPHLDTLNSEIKALLMLLLLQSGASQHEIQTTLRLAAKSRSAATTEEYEMVQEEMPVEAAPAPRRVKQVFRPEHLAPIGANEFAA
jgi:hypothetical protein